MTDRDLYSIDEARQRLGGISRNSLYQILRTGQLASVVIGGRRFVSATAIAEFIARSTTTVSPAQAAARSSAVVSHARNLSASSLFVHARRSESKG